MSHFGATNCLQKTKDCEAQMRENIGEAMACGDCVCSVKNPESCAHKNDTQNHICEGKIDYEGKEVYNCVLAPDREKCIDSVIACFASEDTRGMHTCDNCVCRDAAGAANCAITDDDCVATCNPESGCVPVTNPKYASARSSSPSAAAPRAERGCLPPCGRAPITIWGLRLSKRS
jgi:hypothetical protein